MNKKDKSFIPIEAFSIPEDTIFLDSESLYEPIKLAIKGLKKTIKEMNLDWHLKNKSEKNNLIIINGFTIQILFTGFTSDEIEIPLKYWFRKKGFSNFKIIFYFTILMVNKNKVPFFCCCKYAI